MTPDKKIKILATCGTDDIHAFMDGPVSRRSQKHDCIHAKPGIETLPLATFKANRYTN